MTATAGQDPVSFWRSQLERQSPAEQPPAVSRVQRLAIILAVAAVVGAALIIVIVPMIERQLA